ncbi:MAG TPA: hypothetical protein VHT96_04125 [Clostridia bacterium]|nr:hypothetical protein [Clostridia bacterium]
MVDSNQAVNNQSTEKSAAGQPRSEQPKNEQPRSEQPRNEQPRSEQPRSEQPRSDQNRGRNYQGYNQGQRQHNQARQQNQQNTDAQVSSNRESQGQNQSQNTNQGHFQPRNNMHQAKQHDPHVKENGQQRGYYRDREKPRDIEKDAQPRQHTGAPQARYGNNQRSRAEETIDDIKQDIIRLEKEIDLEIKEIRSMKL